VFLLQGFSAPTGQIRKLPEFSYKMAYRRMLEVQGRQLWRFVRGEAAAYHGFNHAMTREWQMADG